MDKELRSEPYTPAGVPWQCRGEIALHLEMLTLYSIVEGLVCSLLYKLWHYVLDLLVTYHWSIDIVQIACFVTRYLGRLYCEATHEA